MGVFCKCFLSEVTSSNAHVDADVANRFFCEILLINLVDAIGYIKLNKDCDLTVHISSIHGYRKLLIERLIDVEVIRR